MYKTIYLVKTLISRNFCDKVILKKLLKSWFHEIFFRCVRVNFFFHSECAAHSVEITEFLFLRVYGWVHEQIVVIWVRLSEINLHLLCHLSDEFFKGDNGMGCNIVCLIPIGCTFFNYSNYHIGSIFYVCYWFCYLSVRKRWTIIYQKFVEYHSLLQVSLENKKER